MKKVVLVDDDVDFCEATKLLLESKDFEVVLAYDGREGLEKIRNEQPDLVILDVMMPEMNGYDVCVVLKADPALKENSDHSSHGRGSGRCFKRIIRSIWILMTEGRRLYRQTGRIDGACQTGGGVR